LVAVRSCAPDTPVWAIQIEVFTAVVIVASSFIFSSVQPDLDFSISGLFCTIKIPMCSMKTLVISITMNQVQLGSYRSCWDWRDSSEGAGDVEADFLKAGG
jgi:hypothetical protein